MVWHYNATFSSGILIEETSYDNTVTLNALNSTGYYVGTFSAPFPTILPDGVSAYYVSGTNTDNTAATLAKYEGTAIPENTGVLLASTSTDVTSALMVPATEETSTEISNNQLGNTAGATATVASDNTSIYILATVNEVMAFYLSAEGTMSMNKAYLNYTTGGSASQLKLDFGTATSIEGVEAAEAETNKVIYDLSGRSVKNAQKGLYIVNGKKVIVK